MAGCQEDAETDTAVALAKIGTYTTSIFDQSAAEIVAYDKTTQQAFVVNANSGKIDILDSSDPSAPSKNGEITLADDISGTVGAANSVDINNGLLAVAVENKTKTNNDWVAFYQISEDTIKFIKEVSVGALPDMLTFTPDGSQVLVALEGEPSDNYSIDPEGKVALIDINWDGNNLITDLTELDFNDFNDGQIRNAELPKEKMVLDGLSANISQNFEPEYITVSTDGREAFVSLQENNALAVIDLTTKRIDRIIGLGFKDYSLAENAFDASQKDGVNLQSWPVKGIYIPDTIESYQVDGITYVVTANEGDDRQDWLENVTDQTACESAGYYFDAKDNCVDAFSAKDYFADNNVTLSSGLAANGGFGDDNQLRRLKFSYHTTVVKNGSTFFSELYAYGGRSFSIYNAATGEQVFDSANDFERITAEIFGNDFNNDNAENSGDDRSDNKGPEPEALALGTVGANTYAFIGLERMGGIMVYNITDPNAVEFVQYFHDRNTSEDVETSVLAGNPVDYGPEGIKFISAEDSPNGMPMLIVANEVSGTTSYFKINEIPIE